MSYCTGTKSITYYWYQFQGWNDQNEYIRFLQHRLHEAEESAMNLGMIIATVEVEAKVEAEKSLKHIQSELNFKVI